MSFKPASLSTIRFVEHSLLKSIEAENALPPGLSDSDVNLKRVPWEPPRALNLGELRASILETVELLRHQLLQTAAAVCRRHNSLLPIQRLPPEILSACIGHAMADIDAHNHQKRLVQLSTVSWWWRTVALDTPSLWGVIHSKDPDWIVSLALDRSKGAPITVLYESGSDSKNLVGSTSYRTSIALDDFFKLVSPHTNRWQATTLPYVGSGAASNDWLNQHKIQLSRHLRKLTLCWNGSASTGNPITGFSGLAERLSELKLHQLHVHPPDIKRILAASTRLVVLDLESLVVLGEDEGERQSETGPDDTFRATIDLPYLTRLNLKWLPSSILSLVVQNLNPTNKVKVSLAHDMAGPRDANTPAPAPEPFAAFISRLISTDDWVGVYPMSTKVTVRSRSCSTSDYNVELRGQLSVILPWLRLGCLPQITRDYLVWINIDSDSLGDNPGPAVIESLARFPKVEHVNLLGPRESWRWAWLLSLPDAVRTEPVDSERRGGSWLWPDLKCLNINGDFVNEFTLLSVLLARQGPQRTGESASPKNPAPCRLETILVRPRAKPWRLEVLDRIKGLIGPGGFKWSDPR